MIVIAWHWVSARPRDLQTLWPSGRVRAVAAGRAVCSSYRSPWHVLGAWILEDDDDYMCDDDWRPCKCDAIVRDQSMSGVLAHPHRLYRIAGPDLTDESNKYYIYKIYISESLPMIKTLATSLIEGWSLRNILLVLLRFGIENLWFLYTYIFDPNIDVYIEI